MRYEALCFVTTAIYALSIVLVSLVPYLFLWLVNVMKVCWQPLVLEECIQISLLSVGSLIPLQQEFDRKQEQTFLLR